METIFTLNEAAAFAYLPLKRVYKELEYRVIQPVEDVPRLSGCVANNKQGENI